MSFLPQRQHTGHFLRHLSARSRRGRAEGDNAWQILRAAAHPALLPTAANERIGEMDTVMPANKRADALRTADLMRRNSHQIGPKRADVAGDAPRRLHRIDMQQAAGRVHQSRRFGDGLDHASFVVREHHRNQRPADAGQRCRQCCKIQSPVGSNRKLGDYLGRKASAGADGRMLNRRDEQKRRAAFSLWWRFR